MSATLNFVPNSQVSASSNSPGGAAGVEIVGFPQILYTRAFGDPDMLFMPLLRAAREAFQMTQRLHGLGEARPSAVTLSGMQLASALLRDSSFSLGAKGLSHENLYIVDLDAGTMLVHTRLYAVVSRRTSFFKVEIVGKIAEGLFVVRNSALGTTIGQFEEEKSRAPGFFANTLAQECLRAQMDQERFGRLDDNAGSDAEAEVRMLVPVSGARVPVVLRQKQVGGAWDVVDGRRQESVGSLSEETRTRLMEVIQSVQHLFAQNKS